MLGPLTYRLHAILLDKEAPSTTVKLESHFPSVRHKGKSRLAPRDNQETRTAKVGCVLRDDGQGKPDRGTKG